MKPVIDAMHRAVEDLSQMETFHGYGASSGYDFLKKAILKNDYAKFHFSTDEIYISNGTKTDVCSILELFDENATIGIIGPIYPIYKNGSLCLNRKIRFFSSKEEEGFLPTIPNEKVDILYLCSPNNPIGIAYDENTLKKIVEYAIRNETIILFDNAYYAFVHSQGIPKSIYEIEGAEKVAIEFRSFSKSASFTGVRCSYFVIPNAIHPSINDVWKKRTINRFNGADYIAQRGAEASYLEESKEEIQKNMKDYLAHTKILKEAFRDLGFTVYGGEDSPFIWVKIKEKNVTSWDIFHLYLEKLNIIITPGIIFGLEGNQFFRVSGLASVETIQKAIERIRQYYES